MSSSLRRGVRAAAAITFSLLPLAACAAGNDAQTLQIKPGNAAQGPTPLVDSLVIHLQDLPPRVAGFLYPALDYELTPDQARGLFEVTGAWTAATRDPSAPA